MIELPGERPAVGSGEAKALDVAAMVPGVGVFGGVRRFIEIGNELVRRGHDYTLYHPGGEPPDWLPFDGRTRPLADLVGSRHHVLICNDPPLLDAFEKARADVKCFYFALENTPREREIARHPGWVILANSSGMHERLTRKYRVPVEKVIGGIDLQLFKPPQAAEQPKNEYRVLTFGRLSRRKKGVPIVVRAVESFARTAARRDPAAPRVTLVLFDHVGPHNEADPRDDFKTKIRHEFHVNLSQTELAGLYARCDVFVSAEKRAGWANTTAEAMACGVPVVCTRSGTRDIAEHLQTAWVVRWRHAHFVGNGLRALHGDAALARRLRDNALRRIRRFSWASVVDQLEDVVVRRLRNP